jgi:hypothetical protein
MVFNIFLVSTSVYSQNPVSTPSLNIADPSTIEIEYSDWQLGKMMELFDNDPISPLSYLNYYENYTQGITAMKLSWLNPEDYKIIN